MTRFLCCLAVERRGGCKGSVYLKGSCRRLRVFFFSSSALVVRRNSSIVVFSIGRCNEEGITTVTIWWDDVAIARESCITYLIKIKIHSSCEIEDFVETHLCKLCVILRPRVLLCVSSLRI